MWSFEDKHGKTCCQETGNFPTQWNLMKYGGHTYMRMWEVQSLPGKFQDNIWQEITPSKYQTAATPSQNKIYFWGS